jgi:hypothetical protein
MKALITVLSLAALATTSAMAQAPRAKAVRANLVHIYQSDAQVITNYNTVATTDT